MLKLFVCVSLLAVLTGADYDFKDPDFNGLLFDDLTVGVNDDFLDPVRLRRGAANDNEPNECQHKKNKKEKDYHCCNGEKANTDELDAVKEIKKNCIAEIRGESDNEANYDPLNCDSVQSMKDQIVCAAECMAKKFDLIAESGDLKRDALLNHTRKLVGGNKWKASVLEGYVDKCLADMKASKELKETNKTKAPKCNPLPLDFHHCIWKAFVEGCPAESQIDSKKCQKIRERLAKGDTSYVDKSFKKAFRPHH